MDHRLELAVSGHHPQDGRRCGRCQPRGRRTPDEHLRRATLHLAEQWPGLVIDPDLADRLGPKRARTAAVTPRQPPSEGRQRYQVLIT
jgi:hypothetical protein